MYVFFGGGGAPLLPTGVHEHVLLISTGWLAHVLTKWREMVERNIKTQNLQKSKTKITSLCATYEK